MLIRIDDDRRTMGSIDGSDAGMFNGQEAIQDGADDADDQSSPEGSPETGDVETLHKRGGELQQ